MIKVYVSNAGCVKCMMTTTFLKQHNVDFQEYSINDLPTNMQAQVSSLPVVFVDDELVCQGFNAATLSKLVQSNK